MIETIKALSNEDYHSHKFWGSTNLRNYEKGAAKAMYEKQFGTHEDSSALRFGSLVHGLLAGEKYNVVSDPINPKTGNFYGQNTKEVQNLLSTPNTVLLSEYETAQQMINNFANHNAKFFESCMKGEKEVSYFIDEPEYRMLKYRPDAKNSIKLIDYKTVKSDDWNRKGILKLCYSYAFQAAMYQKLEFVLTGIHKPLFWVFMLKEVPFDTLIVNASDWGYNNDKNYISLGDGAILFEKVLRLHNSCVELNQWGGLASEFEADNYGNIIVNKQDLQL